MTKTVASSPVHPGAHALIPLNRLLKSPDNVRKVPHSEAALTALRASIAAKGLLQNLTVAPECNDAGEETGFYFVTIGEGRRLAQVARAKAGEIDGDTPIPCVIRRSDDAQEVSLDENVTREAMHPADQFEAFRALNVERGMDASDIAARFGVSEQTVRQRLRLGAVSPRLMQAYRDNALTLNQMMAFALTEDHGRQEAVFDRLAGASRDTYHIRRLLTEGQVPSTDRRAKFVGAEAYEAAGGLIERDLFTEGGGGSFTDAGLLDALAIQKLAEVACVIKAEGWKWVEVMLDFPYSLGMGRVYPHPVDYSPENTIALATAQSALEDLLEDYEGADELPDDVDAQAGTLEAEIERLQALGYGYTPEEVARGGVIVSLAHDASVRIERGLIRAEDEVPEPDADEADEDGAPDQAAATPGETGLHHTDEDAPDEAEKPLSDALWRDLTTHRSYALRLALGEQTELAARVLAHKLALDIFYRRAEHSCLDIRAHSPDISSFADGLDETPTASALAERHGAWAGSLPEQPCDLWDYMLTMEPETLGALMAHCVALTISAVRQPYVGTSAVKAADRVAQRLCLDMNEHWRPTARSYFGRVNKDQILGAVREAVSDDAAERLNKLKKAEMAEAAEQLMVGTGWLPLCLRTEAPDEADGGEVLALPAPDADTPILPVAAE